MRKRQPFRNEKHHDASDGQPAPENEQAAAERRVEELMGPLPEIDGEEKASGERVMGTAPELSAKTAKKDAGTKGVSAPEATETTAAAEDSKKTEKKQTAPPLADESGPEKHKDDTHGTADAEPSPDSVPEEPADAKTYFARLDDAPNGKKSAEKPGLGDDPATSAAVEDIERHEADVALLEETGPGNPRPVRVAHAAKPKHRRRPLKILLWGLFLLLAAVVAAGFLAADVRTTLLNRSGLRTNVLLTTLDGTNNVPLEKVRVEIDGKTVETGTDGKAKLTGLHLGAQTLRVSKNGFAPIEKNLELGLRTTDLGEFVMKPVGAQLTYQLTDYLSGKPVKDAVISTGNSTARSNTSGLAVITLPTDISGEAVIRIEAGGYRTESMPFSQSKRRNELRLVNSQKHVYIARENGRYVLYKIDIDGTNKEVLLDATGNETSAYSLMFDPGGQKVAYISTRGGERNSAGQMVQTLAVVDIASGGVETVDKAKQITPVGWKNSTIVYTLRDDTPMSGQKDAARLQAFDYQANKRLQLASADYFDAAILHDVMVYYVQPGADAAAKKALRQVNINGGDKRDITEQTVESTARIDYKTLLIKTPEHWVGYTFGDADIHEVPAPLSEVACRHYLTSPDGRQTAWVNVRANDNDVLMVRGIMEGNEKPLTTQKTIQGVARWLTNRVVVYHIDSSQETADYAVSLDGGKPVKVTDNTGGYHITTSSSCSLKTE